MNKRDKRCCCCGRMKRQRRWLLSIVDFVIALGLLFSNVPGDVSLQKLVRVRAFGLAISLLLLLLQMK